MGTFTLSHFVKGREGERKKKSVLLFIVIYVTSWLVLLSNRPIWIYNWESLPDGRVGQLCTCKFRELFVDWFHRKNSHYIEENGAIVVENESKFEISMPKEYYRVKLRSWEGCTISRFFLNIIVGAPDRKFLKLVAVVVRWIWILMANETDLGQQTFIKPHRR